MPVSSGLMFGILAVLSYGLADFIAKGAVDKYGPLTALKISLILGTSVVFLYSIFFVEFPQITLNSIIFVLLTGITGVLGWITFYKGLEVGKVSIVSPIASSWGILTFILAIIFLAERLTLFEILASISIFCGMFLISVKWKEFVVATKGKLYKGAGLALLSLLGFGLAGFFVKFIVNELGPFYSVVLTRLVTIVLIFIFATKISTKNTKHVKFEGKFIWLLFLVGLFDAIGYLSFNFGLLVGLVSIVSAVTSAIPFVVVLLAYFFLRERLDVNQYFGILLIMAGFVGLSLL